MLFFAISGTIFSLVNGDDTSTLSTRFNGPSHRPLSDVPARTYVPLAANTRLHSDSERFPTDLARIFWSSFKVINKLNTGEPNHAFETI